MSNDVETRSKRPRRSASVAASASPISEDEQVEPPAFSLATLGLQRVGTAPPPKPQPQLPIQALNARGMPARIRKRNRLFFDDELINDDKPLRMSLSPKKTPIKSTASLAGSSSATASPNRTPSKLLKKRKVNSRYMRQEDASTSSATAASSSKKKYAAGMAPSTPTKSGTAHSTPNHTPKSNRGSRLSMPNTPGGSSTSSVQQYLPADMRVGQVIGMRLKNLLKLPKAHKWVTYEWFYSFIDRPLFDGDNDFQTELNDKYPKLRTRLLTRAEWRKIRSLFGRPRRCSQAFFDEERRDLERKRQKIRFLQTRRTGDIKDVNFLRDLPDKIPLPLPVGTKVAARLRVPQDGIFSGTVDAFDSITSVYRVTFDRAGLGAHSIPDYEIVSENFHEMLPLQSITRDFRPNLMATYNSMAAKSGMLGVRSALNMNLNKSDPLLGQDVFESPFRNPIVGRDNLNGYPISLLETLVRLKRTMTIKRNNLQRLNEMNNEAEMKTAQHMASTTSKQPLSPDDEACAPFGLVEPKKGTALSEDFQRRYASIIISLEKMNRDMQDYLNDIQKQANDLTRDPQVQAMLAPTYLREKCREAAEDAVQRNNQGAIKSDRVLSLIKKLSTVLVVASHLGNDQSTQVSKVLEGCIEEMRSSLHASNVDTFQKNVTIHLHHIRLGIGQSALTPNGSSVSVNVANGSSLSKVDCE